MSDATDWQSQQNQAAQYSVWDPVKKANVNAPQGAASYIAANPQNYQGYTGAVQHISNTPIHANAYVPTVGPQPTPGAGGFDPVALQAAQERNALNPYGSSSPLGTYGGSDELSQQLQSWAETVRRIPGGNPTYGVLPGSGLYYNLLTQQQQDPNKLDPLTKMYGQMTQQMPGKIPTLAQTTGPKGLGISGRGYELKGLNPAQQKAQQAALGGNRQAAAWLASTLGRNWQSKQQSGIQKFASQYFGPALMTAIGALATGGVGAAAGPLAGAATGAGFGMFSQGAQTKWKDPAAIGIGGAGGFLGGWGGGQLGQALGAGAMGTGALAGAGGSLGAGVPMQAYKGQWDPAQLARNAAIAGAVSGGAAGLQGMTKPGYVNTPGEPGGGFKTPPTVPPAVLKATMPYVKQGIGTTLDYYLPGQNKPPNPYAERQRADEEARRRRLALTQARRR